MNYQVIKRFSKESKKREKLLVIKKILIMNTLERMYPSMSAAELSNIILRGKGKQKFYLIILHKKKLA